MLPKKLFTPRLTLFRWEESYAEAYADLCSDASVMAYIAEGLPYSAERAFQSQKKISKHWDQKGYGMYGLFEHQSDELIGIAGLATADYLKETAVLPEIGWRLKKRLWGKGLASEAANAIIGELRKNRSLPAICAVIHQQNQRSQKLAGRLGFSLSHQDIDKDFLNPVQIWHLRLSGKGE